MSFVFGFYKHLAPTEQINAEPEGVWELFQVKLVIKSCADL